MSVYNLPTNFTELIEPRTLECVIATPYGDAKVAYGNTGTVPSGYTTQAYAGGSLSALSYNSFIGAGSIIKGVSLMNPTQGTFAAGGFTYTISSHRRKRLFNGRSRIFSRFFIKDASRVIRKRYRTKFVPVS